LQKAPRAKPPLPIKQPAGAKWEVWVVAVTGRFALSIRRLGKTYPNVAVEKHLGIPATTRNWNTIEVICEVLEKQSRNSVVKIKYFKSASEFSRWLEVNYTRLSELWVGFFKKDSGKGGLTCAEAVDEALCFGW